MYKKLKFVIQTVSFNFKHNSFDTDMWLSMKIHSPVDDSLSMKMF